MKLTTKGRYAVTAMLDLAMHQAQGPVSVSDIAKRQDLSQSYLEQLFGKLRKHELVNSIRGPGGGYELTKEPKAITVADIVGAINDSVDTTQCAGAENCRRGERCLTHNLWSSLNNVISNFLQSVTLADIRTGDFDVPINRKQRES